MFPSICPHCKSVQSIPPNYINANVKCPSCANDYIARVREPEVTQPKKAVKTIRQEPKSGSDNLALISIIAPILGAVLIWVWIGEMSLLEGASSKFNLISLLVVFGTGIMLGIDADRLQMGKNGDKGFSAVFVAILICLLWFVFYPLYFFHRRKYTNQNFGYIAILSMILFVLAFYQIGGAIKNARNEVGRGLDNLERSFDRF